MQDETGSGNLKKWAAARAPVDAAKRKVERALSTGRSALKQANAEAVNAAIKVLSEFDTSRPIADGRGWEIKDMLKQLTDAARLNASKK